MFRLSMMSFALIILAGTAFAEDVETTIAGRVRCADRASAAGIKVQIDVDQLWGRRDEAGRDKFEESVGKLPKISGSASAETDETGAFAIKFTAKGDGPLPTRPVRTRTGLSDKPYVYVTIRVEKAGYVSARRDMIMVEVGEMAAGELILQRESSLRLRIFQLSNRKPVAGMKLQFTANRYRRGTAFPPFEVSTDSEGVVELKGEDCPTGGFTLRSVDDKWAFPLSSKAWQRQSIGTGAAMDMGNLMVVAAARLKFKLAIEVDSDKFSVPCRLVPLRGFRGRGSDPIREVTLSEPEVEWFGLPPGKLKLETLQFAGHWDGSFEVELKSGETTDLGTITLVKKERLEIHAFKGEALVTQFTSRAMCLEGKAPEAFRRARRRWRNGVGVLAGVHTPESSWIDGMWDGRWLIEIRSAGCAPSCIEVTIPASKPLQVDLTPGGSLVASVLGLSGEATAQPFFAIQVDSPAYREFEEGDGRNTRQLPNSSSRAIGMFSEDSSRNRQPTRVISNLPPGLYTLAIYFPNGRMFMDNVLIEEGVETKVDFKPVLYSIRVQLKQNGLPVADTGLVLISPIIPGTWWRGQTAHRSVDTDAAGVGEFANLRPGVYWIYTKREWDWMHKKEDRHRSEQSRYSALARPVTLTGDTQVELELVNPDRAWLTVRAEFRDGFNPYRASIRPLKIPPNRRSITQFNWKSTGVEFGPMPTGDYLIVFSGREDAVEKIIRLGAEGFDETLKWTYHKVSVKMKGTGWDNWNGRVTLSIAEDDPRLSDGRYRRAVHPQGGGEFVFENVPSGTYDAVTYKDGSTVRKRFTVKGDTETSLEFIPATGKIELQVDAATLPRSLRSQGRIIVHLFSEGKRVALANPFEGYGVASGSSQITSVLPGTYKLVAYFPAMEPFVVESLQVKDKRTTKVKLNFKRSALMDLFVDNATLIEVNNAVPIATLEDAAGKIIPFAAPDFSLVYASQTFDGRVILHIFNLPTNVRKIRIKLTGYEEIVVPVKVSSGQSAQGHATLVKKFS